MNYKPSKLPVGSSKIYCVQMVAKKELDIPPFYKVGVTSFWDVADRFKEEDRFGNYRMTSIFASAIGRDELIYAVEAHFKRMYPKDIYLEYGFKGISEILSTMSYEEIVERVSMPIRELAKKWKDDPSFIPSFLTEEDFREGERTRNYCPMD